MNRKDSNPHQNPLYTTPFHMGGLEIAPIDLLEHVLATGGTGSGKTRSFLLPLVESVLTRFGNEADQKAGMVLIDAKGDMGELAARCVERSGRKEDFYLLGPGGNCWFSIFSQFEGDATGVSNFLYETLQDRCNSGGGCNEAFWEENARRLLRAAVTCAKAAHGFEFGGLEGISNGLNMVIKAGKTYAGDDDDDDNSGSQSGESVIKNVLDEGFVRGNISGAERRMLISYIENDVRGGNARTWSTIANYSRNFLAQFSQPALQELFKPSPQKRRLIPEDVIDQGLLLVVSLSPVVYGEAATPFRIAIKKAFCQRILQRNQLIANEAGERAINQIRPILYVMDEFHTILSAGGRSSDAYFLDRAREFRCMCLLASQGISAINSVLSSVAMLNHLLNNCRTKFFFANDCPQTSEYFEFIGGMEYRMATTLKYEHCIQPPRFRLPNHSFVEGPKSVITGHTLDTKKDSRFSSAKLGSLPNGTALVVAKGRRLVVYKMDPAHYC